jgi:hypothetical protein
MFVIAAKGAVRMSVRVFRDAQLAMSRENKRRKMLSIAQSGKIQTYLLSIQCLIVFMRGSQWKI